VRREGAHVNRPRPFASFVSFVSFASFPSFPSFPFLSRSLQGALGSLLPFTACAPIVALAACAFFALAAAQSPAGNGPPSADTHAAPRRPRTRLILDGAYRQVGVTTIYDPRYTVIPFPGGDVPMERGVCCDVIVRAYRRAGLDLQALVHQDMMQSFASYPRIWGLTKPDSNIDHRRVPNLATFFTRHGTRLPASSRASDYDPADIVTWRLWTGATHIGLVSDRFQDGRPLVVHNVGAGTQIEDVLFAYEITGHYRYDP
jgi:uncharacterized protein YijF (DUF1287 family)